MGTLPLREGQRIQFMFALKVAHECITLEMAGCVKLPAIILLYCYGLEEA